MALERAQQGHVPDYNDIPPEHLNVPMPASPKDIPKEPYGPPPEWDYRTAELGWNNEPKPPGAVGWTKFGTPWYGTNNAVSEWAKGAKWRITERDVETFTAEQAIEARKQSWQNLRASIEGFEETGVAGVVGAYVGGIATSFDVISQVFEEKSDDLVEPGLFAKASRTVGELLQLFGLGLGEAAIGWERAAFMVDESLEEIGAESTLAEWKSPTDWLYEQALEYDTEGSWGDAARFIGGIVERLDILDLTWNQVRSTEAVLSGKVTTQEYFDVLDKNWQAGRIAYSAAINPALKSEYIRRYQNGENPYLLSLELQNPVAEGIGQSILDPLFFVGIALKGRAVAKKFKNSKQYVGTLARGLESVAELELDKLDDLEKLATATHDVATAVKNTRKSFTAFDKAKGIFKLTSQGLRNHTNRLVGDYLGEIVRIVGPNPDDVLEVIEAAVKIVSDDALDVTEGLMALGEKLPLNQVLSEGGLRSAIAIEEMMKNADGVFDAVGFLKDVEGATDGADLLNKMLPRLNRATNSIFPTIAEKQAEIDKLKKAGKLAEASLLELTGADKFLSKFEAAAGNKFLRGVNTMFANMYMGLSPGYAVRNGITNTVHVLIDQGIGAYIDGKGYMPMGRVNEQLGEMLLGITPMGLRSAMGGPAAAGLGVNVSDKKWYNTFMQVSRQMEINAGSRIMLKSLKDTFRKMGPYVLDSAGLTKVGMSADDISFVKTVIKNSYYDFDTAMPIIRDAIKTGNVDIFKSMEWLPDAEHKSLDAYDILDDVMELRNRKDITSADEVARAIDEIFDEKFKYADNVAYDPGNYTNAAERASDLEHLPSIQAYDAGSGAGPELKAAFTRSMTQNKITDDAYRQATAQTITAAKSQLGDDVVDAVISTNPNYVMLRDGTFFDDVMKENDLLIGTVNHHTYVALPRGEITPAESWRLLGIPGNPPENMTVRGYKNYMWDGFHKPRTRQTMALARDQHAIASVSLQTDLVKAGYRPHINDQKLFSNASVLAEKARDLDTSIVKLQKRGLGGLHLPAHMHQEFDDVMNLARINEITSKSAGGANLDKVILRTIEKYTDQSLDNLFEPGAYEALELALKNKAKEVTDFDPVFLERIVEEFADVEKVAEGVEGAEKAADVVRPIGVSNPDGVPSNFEPFNQARPGLTKLRENVKAKAVNAFGKQRPLLVSDEVEEALQAFEATGRLRASEMRSTGVEVANSARDFGLVDYGAKRGVDLPLGFIYPYQYWYGRTYKNWLGRLAMEPGILAAYSRYKDTLAKIHAGQPEWWKYNVNTNELLGLDFDNPLLFNLEATLNPLNGLSGVDFDDKYKRVNGWTKFLDGLGRFGPSVHPLIQIGTALSLKMQGDDEASARWLGRPIPQTKPLMAIDSLIGDDPVEERDPLINLFSGGINPYLAKRTGRALGGMILDGTITEEQALDAGFAQEGDIWDAAMARAVQERALGDLTGFVAGAGFRARSTGDLMADYFYNDFYSLIENRPNLSPSEYRQQMDNLGQQYPMMDTLLVSRKPGKERDTAYAYTILSRIPPGQSRDILEMVGLSPAIVSGFYDDKGDFDEWKDSDYKTFMGAIANLGSVLAVPKDATQQEWTAARSQYREINDFMESAWGDDIHDKVSRLYGLFGDSQEDRNNVEVFTALYPEAEQAMQYRNLVIAMNPESELATYYGGIKQLDDFWRSNMYNEARELFGDDIQQLQEQYFQLPSSQRKQFRNQNPRLTKYWDYIRKEKPGVNQKVIDFGKLLDIPLGAEVRPDIEDVGFGAQNLLQQIFEVGPYARLSPGEWEGVIGDRAFRHVERYLEGRRLSSYALDQIESQAQRLGMDENQLIQLIGISLQNAQ
jgi:hypothetical protein